MNMLLERPAKGAVPSRRVRRLMLALARDQRRLEAVMLRDLTPQFRHLGVDAARAYRAAPKSGTTVIQLLAALGVTVWRDKVLTPVYERAYLRTAIRTEDTIEAILRLGIMLPDHVGRRIVATGGRRVGLVDMEGQTRDALFRALAEGRAEGLGPEALAHRIEQRVAGGRYLDPITRARVIARTETKYAQNVSTLEVYQQSDVITGVVAYDNRTGDGDDECTARDGEFFTFDDAQIEADSEHPNGTLSFGPATE